MKSISELKLANNGHDVYVLGSGPSLNYINPEFFYGKVTVGVNKVYKHFPCTYVVIHHQEHGQDIIDSGRTLVVSETDKCLPGPLLKYEGEYYQYKHKIQGYANIDYSLLDSDDGLVIGETTIINALSFAYFIGARNIVLCGVDCGTIDDRVNFEGYYTDLDEKQLRRVRSNALSNYPRVLEFARLLRKKNIGVHSLNPFVNLALEGHTWKPS